MSKKKSIISYEKMTIDQKKELLVAFPNGFDGHITKMIHPITNETYDSLLWDTEEVTYLVKLPKQKFKSPSVDDDDDDDFDEEIDKFDAKDEDDDSSSDDDDDDSYDKPEEGEEDEDED